MKEVSNVTNLSRVKSAILKDNLLLTLVIVLTKAAPALVIKCNGEYFLK